MITECEEKEMAKKQTKETQANKEDLEPIRKWADKKHPKAKSIKISYVYGDSYRVNVFDAVKADDCVVEKVTLSSSYFVEMKNGKIKDMTKGSK
jgi:hypothetical protein